MTDLTVLFGGGGRGLGIVKLFGTLGWETYRIHLQLYPFEIGFLNEPRARQAAKQPHRRSSLHPPRCRAGVVGICEAMFYMGAELRSPCLHS